MCGMLREDRADYRKRYPEVVKATKDKSAKKMLIKKKQQVTNVSLK